VTSGSRHKDITKPQHCTANAGQHSGYSNSSIHTLYTAGILQQANTCRKEEARATTLCMAWHAQQEASSCVTIPTDTGRRGAHACICTRMRKHTSACARTRATTYIFGCALTDWGHTPQLWFEFRKTLSLFGCLALFVLHSHGLASCAGACMNAPACVRSVCACACMHACSSAETCVRAWSAYTCQGACVSVRARSIASCAVHVHSCADTRARMCSVCVHG